MSVEGFVDMYIESSLPDPRRVLADLVRLERPELVRNIGRSIGEDREWDAVENFLDPPLPERLGSLPGTSAVEELPSLYRDGTSLSGEIFKSGYAQRLSHTIVDLVPPDVRGERFEPASLYFTVGWHDLCEYLEDDDGQRIARPFVSLRFGGPGCPNDPITFREMIRNLPEVLEVKQAFESIIGPLEIGGRWYA